MIVEIEKATGVRACPLCGAESHLRTNRCNTVEREQFWVKCSDLQCGCTTSSEADRDKALAKWNRRF